MSLTYARTLTGCAITATVMLLGGCTTVPSIQHSVEIRRGNTVQEKLERAAAVVNEQTLGKIRAEARRRVPDASDEELRRVALVVTKTVARASGKRSTIRIAVIVSLQDPSPEMGSRILQICVQLVDDALNGDAAWLGDKW